MKRRIIFPVILSIPEEEKGFTGSDKVLSLSWHARQALQVSAQKSDLILGSLPKDPEGIPLPVNGNYWSLTHKPEYVGAVAARYPIGFDIEKIRHISSPLFRKTADDCEWALGKEEDTQRLFFRYWTSKEAILKASGTGISDLLKCRIIELVDDTHLIAAYNGKQWPIEHFYFNQHVASVLNITDHIQWTLL